MPLVPFTATLKRRPAFAADLLLVAAMAVAGAGCKPNVKPGLMASIAVEEGKKGERVNRVIVAFDRAMVLPAVVGETATAPPLRIEPKVEGAARWLDARTLVFTAASPLPRSTRYRLMVPAGTVAPDGFGLAEPVEQTFETERLELRAALDSDTPYSAAKWAVPQQKVKLSFNQPVLVDSVERHCRYETGDRKVPVRVLDERGSVPRDRFVVGPGSPLDAGTTWTFRCDDELPGAEGPLSFVPSSPDAGPRAPRREITFETFGAFKVLSVSPSGSDVEPDRERIEIHFSTPVRFEGEIPVKITPAIPSARPYASGADLIIDVGGLDPNTSYNVTLDGAVKDVFGQTLGTKLEATFRTGSAAPKIAMETGQWVVEAARGKYMLWARNVTKLDVRGVALDDAKLMQVLPSLNWWDDETVDLAKLKLKSVERSIEVKGRPNRWDQVALDPQEIFGVRAATGIYYLAVSSPEVHDDKGRPKVQEALVNITNLGITAKMSAGSGLVWVTRLSDGAPQSGADIVIRDGKGKVKWRGKTGADGTVNTPGHGLLAPSKPSVAQAEEEEGEGEMEERPRLLVFARVGADVTFVDPKRYGGFEAWQFSASYEDSSSPERLRGFTHTDRGLYRPGDTVHLRGLVRLMRLGQGLTVPGKRKVEVVVRDPRGDEILRRPLTLSRFGSFNLDLALPGDARLGDYVAETRVAGGVFRDRFAVEEYRAASFEVKVAAGTPSVVAGEQLRVSVDSRYLYGAPVRNGNVKWRIHSRHHRVDFDQHPRYSFEDARSFEGGEHGGESFLTEEEGKLDAQGRGKLSVPLPRESFSHTRDLMVSAEVQDESNQTISSSVAVPVHRARLYFGIENGDWMAPAGKTTPVKVIAVDTAGKRVAGAATLTIRRREWNCAWESWGYSGSYRCDKKETDIAKRALTIPADGVAEGTFVPADSGEYWIIVEGKDARGNPTSSARELWVYGRGEPPWRVQDSGRFEIVADKKSYKIGDTAQLLLKAPAAGATAMVTIEREGVLEHKIVELPATGETLPIPILEGYGPNVYVSVLLARGRSTPGPRGLPSLKMGMVDLKVDSEGHRLKVEVTTDRPSYRPGDQVTASVRVTDGEGKPVQGEVALAAADEGVLSLIAFRTPDPMGTFYAPWALGVRTTSQYDRLAKLPEPEQERNATGGDGPGRLGTMRSRFMATAYWNPRLETDAAGRATVSFKAPDNLTAFRLMAVAADAGDRFGSGDRRFTVRKPLQMLSALPRFLSVGDSARPGVVLINETGQAGTATVDVSIKGAKLGGDARRSVVIPAGGRANVSFPIVAENAGEARFRFSAALGDERDGLELTIPIAYPTSPETTLVSVGETAGVKEIPVTLPEGTIVETATLELSLDPDGLAGIEEGLRDLIQYPYGCLEQTTSRLIPLVAVEDLARTLALPELDGPRLQRYIRIAVEKIGRHQTDEGGFGLWPGSQAEPYLTAYALWGLKLAADAGHPIDRKRVDQGVAYLRRSLAEKVATGGVHNELGEMGSRAFTLYVLGLLGHAEPGYATQLLAQRERLPRYGLAFLAQALAVPLGAANAQVTGLLDELLRAADRKPTFALIRESNVDLDWYMSSDLRTSAIATDAFLYLRPAEPDLPLLVRGLLDQRRNGSWRTTQENLYALVALTHYLKTRPPSTVAVKAALGGKTLFDGPLVSKGADRIRHLSVAMPTSGTVRLEAANGTAHYQARLRFRRDRLHQPAVEDGLGLRRDYLDPATDQPVTSMKAGEMVRVRITVSPSERRQRVAITDWLPGGFEPVNTRFVTSAGAPSQQDDGWYVYREMRDDRISFFVDYFWRATSFTYLVRATTPGTFVVPSATAEEMYRPEVRARTAASTFVIETK